MNDLERWGTRPQSILASREDRAHERAVRAVSRDTREAALRMDAEAAVAARFMDRAVDLDNHRKALAGDDPVLNAVLMRIELGFMFKGERHQRGFRTGIRS